MRKFSNKSKKEKKNTIRRKTKGNRRNNKRRTYRKKMKGGDTHPAAQTVINLVNELETNVNELIKVINIEVINNIPEEKVKVEDGSGSESKEEKVKVKEEDGSGSESKEEKVKVEDGSGSESKVEEEKKKANISEMNVQEIKQVVRNVQERLRLVKNSLAELGQNKESCKYDNNITLKNYDFLKLKNYIALYNNYQDCEESKKKSYIKAVNVINKIPELRQTVGGKLIVLNKIDSTRHTIEKTAAIALLIAIILDVINITTTEKENIAVIEKKARSRRATDAELGMKRLIGHNQLR